MMFFILWCLASMNLILKEVNSLNHYHNNRPTSIISMTKTAATTVSMSISTTQQLFYKKITARPIKVLVLGGSGFVGSTFIERASRRGFEIVSLSRRGKVEIQNKANDKRCINNNSDNNKNNNNNDNNNSNNIIWCQGDASDYNTIYDIHLKYGPFDSCIHAIGLLFDTQSGLKSINKYVSGSNSIPDDQATYDKITRLTAYNAIDSFVNYNYNIYNNYNNVENDSDTDTFNNDDNDKKESANNLTAEITTKNENIKGIDRSFIFISAAEAGWTLPAPVDFLERYLTAKRSVEKKLLAFSNHAKSIIDNQKRSISNIRNNRSSKNFNNSSSSSDRKETNSINSSVGSINDDDNLSNSDGDQIQNEDIDETVVKLRPVIFRPSLIWTWKRPTALISVIPFYIGSRIGLPFVDRPVTVENLVDAMIYSIEDSKVEGIMKFNDIDIMSSKKM